MARIFNASLALALLGCAPLAAGQAQQQTYHFDCDVPPGNVSEWNGTLAGDLLRVSGSIQLMEPRQGAQWLPVASVRLLGEDESSSVGLYLLVTRDAPEELQIGIRAPGGGRDPVVFASVPWKNGPLLFDLSLSESGELDVTAGGRSRLVKLGDFQLTKLSLSCSTAQFVFKDITVSHGTS
jgi:hypothetical protein